MASDAQMSIVNIFLIFLGHLTHHVAAILDLYIHFLKFLKEFFRRNKLINFNEISHTVRTYYSKVRNRPTFVIYQQHISSQNY